MEPSPMLAFPEDLRGLCQCRECVTCDTSVGAFAS